MNSTPSLHQPRSHGTTSAAKRPTTISATGIANMSLASDLKWRIAMRVLGDA